MRAPPGRSAGIRLVLVEGAENPVEFAARDLGQAMLADAGLAEGQRDATVWAPGALGTGPSLAPILLMKVQYIAETPGLMGLPATTCLVGGSGAGSERAEERRGWLHDGRVIGDGLTGILCPVEKPRPMEAGGL